MPAYRSSAEGVIRDAVVKKLREISPGCRIIHEINVSSFSNRIDVLAVGTESLHTVEIKSEKDTLKRLPKQIAAMKTVSNNVYSALHEKFLEDTPGGFFPPDESRKSIKWIYPIKDRRGYVECGAEWVTYNSATRDYKCLPGGALWMLWRSEMHEICNALGVPGVSRFTMPRAVDVIRWHMTGEEITRAVCRALRARQCAEADDPIVEEFRRAD